MTLLICPAYLPNIQYFAWVFRQEKVYFSGTTKYQKQSYRNRTEIYGANGKLKLTIPIRHMKNGLKPLDKDILIAYDTDWQKQHWKSICSAYRSSPYFEYYETDLISFYKKKTVSLFDYNLDIMAKLMQLIEQPFSYEILPSIKKEQKRMNALISTKIKLKNKFESYTQVFDNKHGFLPNLSILDILFNLGPNTVSYLNKTALVELT